MAIDFLDTPVGLLAIHASERGLTQVNFSADGDHEHTPDPNPHTAQARQQLAEYFAGERRTFEVALDQQGTEFQQSVWQQLSQIPFGRSRSYQEIARALDKPKAVRAVGAANGRNPIAIIVPCHRVIGSDGTLVGYAGGLERKVWLLRHEGINLL